MNATKPLLTILLALFVAAPCTKAQVLFTDNFNSTASGQWSNRRGSWSATNGVYSATIPDNIPPTFTGLPYVLENFAIEMDINDVADGGVWLRCDPSGTNGVLLVTGGQGWGSGRRSGQAGRSIYWHVITPANWSAPPTYGMVTDVFTNPGVEDIHLRIEVVGSQYSAYINGESTPITSFVETNEVYSSGHVGLYDFSEQTFDNVVLEIPPGFGPYSLDVMDSGASGITLSWTTNALNWTLESITSLHSNAWNSVETSPSVVGSNFVQTIEIGTEETQKFFRIIRP